MAPKLLFLHRTFYIWWSSLHASIKFAYGFIIILGSWKKKKNQKKWVFIPDFLCFFLYMQRY